MADKEDKNKPPKEASKAVEMVKRGAIQIFNKKRRAWARYVVKYLLPADLRGRIAKNEDAIDTISTMISAFTPSHGLWELTDDFQQDFIHEIILACQEKETGKVNGRVVVSEEEQEEDENLKLFIGLAKLTLVKTLITPERDDFDLAFYNKLSEAEKEIFLRHVAALTDDQFKNLARDVQSLQSFLAYIKNKKRKRLTPAEFKTEALADPACQAAIDSFLKAVTANDAKGQKKFWSRVEEKMEKGELSKIADLHTILNLPLAEIRDEMDWDQKDLEDYLESAAGYVERCGKKIEDHIRTPAPPPTQPGQSAPQQPQAKFGSKAHAENLRERMRAKLNKTRQS